MWLLVSERFNQQLFGFGDAQLAGEEFGEEGVAELREAIDLLVVRTYPGKRLGNLIMKGSS